MDKQRQAIMYMKKTRKATPREAKKARKQGTTTATAPKQANKQTCLGKAGV